MWRNWNPNIGILDVQWSTEYEKQPIWKTVP